MPLHRSDGTAFQWSRMQCDIAIHLADEEHQEVSDPSNHAELQQLVFLWTTCFAEAARLICDKYDVPVDVFDKKMKEFTDRVRKEIRIWKWLESEHQKSDIGIEGVEKRILVMCNAQKIRDGQSKIKKHISILLLPNAEQYCVTLSMSFPNIDDPNCEPHTQKVHFPISTKEGEKFLQEICHTPEE